MSERRAVYQYGMDLREVFKFVEEGYILICPRCQANLIVALDMEAASRQKVFPGIYCPKNLDHVSNLIEIGEPRSKLWERLEALNRERDNSLNNTN
jgi:hypothetical protein